jgi:RimJ/RimL family protein N-acetyltransferase
MNTSVLNVREIQAGDIDLIISYWLSSDPEFLTGMGVDLTKMPDREQWRAMLTEQLDCPYESKKSYCIIWLENDRPVGHSNVNKITYGKEAFMHLHMWNPENRQRGSGTVFVKLTIPYFFKNLKLDTLYCEPYSLNDAPNKTLEKAGFTFMSSYTCTPGWINFEQEVNRWAIQRDQLQELGYNLNP